VAEHDEDAAVKDATVLANHPVGDEPTENRCAPGRSGVGAVKRGPVAIRESQSSIGDGRDHVIQEEGAHAVVAEPLPHLRKKQSGQPARVAKESRVSGTDVG
jgi:hypothetical protein